MSYATTTREGTLMATKKLLELTVKELEALVKKYKIAYYDGKPLISDAKYDEIENTLRRESPNSTALKVDSPKVRKEHVKLPYRMGSMTKIKDPDVVEKFLEANPGPYVLSDKLDGVSIEIANTDGTTRAYTRGRDGAWGLEITSLLPHMNVPKKLAKGVAVRAEMIMPLSKFNAKWSKEVNDGGFENPRNLVAGATNAHRNELSKTIKDIHVVAYELLNPRIKVSSQFKELVKLGFEVAHNQVVDECDYSMLVEILKGRKKKSKYEIDGLIITTDQKHPINKSDNPDWSRAFKAHDPDAIKSVKVVGVLWTISKHGLLKPRVEIEPTRLSGVTVTYATGHNAKYIKDNKIGPGAVIKIVRSGEVIPYIMDVIKPGSNSMPKNIDYSWTSTGVDIVTTTVTSDQKVKQLGNFFSTLGVEDMQLGTIQRLYDDGLNTVKKVIQATPSRFLKVEGIQDKTANKLYRNIQAAIDKPELPILMDASGCFGRGFGTRKSLAILKAIPNFMTAKVTEEKLHTVPGFSGITAKQFIKGLDAFKKFLDVTGIEYSIPKEKKVKQTGDKFKGQFVTLTGFRDDDLANWITSQGGTMVDYSKKTTVLIYKDGKENSKTANFSGKLIPLSKIKR